MKADKELWVALGWMMLAGAVVELIVSVIIVGVFLWML